MDVAVAEEPQKKIFRARKTMKISDRQQLEALHNTLSSSKPACPSPPLVNGRHPDEEPKETEKLKEKTSAGSSPKEARSASPTSRSPTPLALSLSLSPSPPAKTPEEVAAATPPPSPSSSLGGPGTKETEKGKEDEGKTATSPSPEPAERKDGEREEEEGQGKASVLPEKEKEDQPPKPQGSPEEGGPLVDPPSLEGAEEDTEKATESEEAVTMDTGPSNNALEEDISPILEKMAAASSLMQSPTPLGTTASSSPSLSPSHAPESDQEVKEGFLVLSEEEENPGEKEEEKEKEEDQDKQDADKMEVDTEKEGEKEESAGTVVQSASPPPASSAPSPGQEAGEGNGASVAAARKRAISGEAEASGQSESGEKRQPDGQEGLESQRKRPRVDQDELEAHIELKISGNTSSRHKLEKVVQQLVAEQLRVLQLSVFDRSLQELRERVEKIDCATKHQHTLDTLQAKIARLTKKFGAANQATENLRRPLEISSSVTNSSPAQRTARSIQDSRRTEPSPSPASSSGSAGHSKPLSVPSSSTSSSVTMGPVLTLSTMSSSASPTSSISSAPPSTSQNQALPAKTTTPSSPAAPGSAATVPKPVSLQPLLIQLPLAVTSTQGGTLLANHSSGVELVPVTSLAGASSLNKAKTTNAGTTFIIQKTVPPSSSSSSSAPLPSSPSLPQITVARAAVYPGGGGMGTTPGSAVPVTSARTPAQCTSVVGATSASSLPASSTPAATGGQSTGAAASAPLSGAAMASKTDTQATSRAPDSTTPQKSPAQASRSGKTGAVIDLTEDDDDVLVTGVKKAPVQSGSSVSASPSSSSPSSAGQRVSGVSSHATMHTQPAAQTTVNVSQRCQAVAPSPSRVLPHSSSSKSSITLPSSGTGAVGSVRGAAGVTAGVGNNRQGSPQATGATVRSSPQITQHLNGPQLTVHHRPLQDSLSKNLTSASVGPGPAHPPSGLPPASLPPLPSSPAPPPRLPPEAAHTSPPQQPQLKLARVQSQNGIVLSWCVEETDRTCAAVDSYHLYAYHQDHSSPAPAASGSSSSPPASQWKKIGEVKALPLPMACTLTQFVSGSKYYFAVRARDVYGRFGPFCEPQCTDVITPSSASS